MRVKELLGRESECHLQEGVAKIINWYTANRDREYVHEKLDMLLYER